MGWVRVGAWCVCVDQEWFDSVAGEEVQGPLVGDIHQVVGINRVGSSLCIMVDGWEDDLGRPMLYEAAAFRPVSDAERDASYFAQFLKDSSVLERVLECSP